MRFSFFVFNVAMTVVCLFFFETPAFSVSPVVVSDDLTTARIGKHIEYLKDANGSLRFNDVRNGRYEWEGSKSESFNFGFTDAVYWMRFTIENQRSSDIGWYLEINYPMIDSVGLWYPGDEGAYVEKHEGDKTPFYEREIIDRNFIFDMNLSPGKHAVYLKFKTTSSLNFTPSIWSYASFIKRINIEFPIFWIYFGTMLVMLLYNFFLFLSIREFPYLVYVIFLLFYILFDATLSGFAFQYLWPDAIWWANNVLPFFMLQSIVWAGFFCLAYVESRKNYPGIHKVFLYGSCVPLSVISLVAFTGNYALSIKVATAGVGYGALVMYACGMALIFRKNREARILMASFLVLFVGVLMYVLKTFGILPAVFITNWSYHIGSTLLVLMLSFGLADKVNVMKRKVEKFNVELQDAEKQARERARYLEEAVSSIREMARELFAMSRELSVIGSNFTNLSTEQAATSEEMSASFEELTSSNEHIHESTVNQSGEGKKTRELVSVLTDSQRNVARVSASVLEGMEVITSTAHETGDNLSLMVERIEYIDQGGKAIDGITAMIDDITDRINLLSLNAAIEAARAGEAGRGFSVVADEISKLAAATSDNSREISAQIKRMIDDIIAGKSIVDKTKLSLDIIFSRIDEINGRIEDTRGVLSQQGNAIQEVMKQADLMENLSNDIATATREQNLSMEENIKTVNRLAEIAQEIAVSNQKVIEFTGSIAEKSKKLEEIISNIS